jgi:GWxTD domain-containing protein
VPRGSTAGDTPYQRWLNEDVVYIISAGERTAFERLQTDAERDHFIEQFWLRRDPTPGTPANEMNEEHYRRIAYANERFSAQGLPGWKADRGQMYIKLGPPHQIESHRTGNANGGQPYPFEQWLYRYVEGIGTDVKLEFEDRTGTGEFQMSVDPRWIGGDTYFSTGPGSRAEVVVTPRRIILARIPIEFTPAQYSIKVIVRSADGKMASAFQHEVSLCKNSPVAGCLERRFVELNPLVPSPLGPGDYEVVISVGDASGGAQKSYQVKFPVN